MMNGGGGAKNGYFLIHLCTAATAHNQQSLLRTFDLSRTSSSRNNAPPSLERNIHLTTIGDNKLNIFAQKLWRSGWNLWATFIFVVSWLESGVSPVVGASVVNSASVLCLVFAYRGPSLECILEGPSGSWSTSQSRRRSGDRHFPVKQRKTFILPVCACMCEYTSNILRDCKWYQRLREKQRTTDKQGSTGCCDGLMGTGWTLVGEERTPEMAMVAFAWDHCTLCCKHGHKMHL